MKTSTPCGNTERRELTSWMNSPHEDHLQTSGVLMGEAENRNPSEPSDRCFIPNCQEFSNDSALLHVEEQSLSTRPKQEILDLKEHKNLITDQGKSAIDSDTPKNSSCSCDCEKRLQEIEKTYRMKLDAAQLQIKKYQRDLSEQSHKAMQWHRKVIVMQSALKAMKQKRTIPPVRLACSEKPDHHVED